VPILTLSETQVVDLIKQLSPETQRAALLALAEGAIKRRDERMLISDAQIRRIAADRGLAWDDMSDNEREALIDDLVHEDRSCGKFFDFKDLNSHVCQ